MEKLGNRILKGFNFLMLILFLPVLFCVFFIGNNMDYYENEKLTTMLSNSWLFIIALAAAGVWVVIFLKCKKTPLRNGDMTGNLLLIISFVVLYFINIRITREIAFKSPWDYQEVREAAYMIANKEAIGYRYYFSMYSNNIPIIYILGKIYGKVMQIENYGYVYDFIWLQVNCVLISLAGYFSCLLVKKLLKNWIPVIMVFLLYSLLVILSPWKMSPYTDTYSMAFPVICIYLYVCSGKAEKLWMKYVLMILSLMSGMIGGFIKPSAYLAVFAVVLAEMIAFIKDYKGKMKFIVVEFLLLTILYLGKGQCFNYIINDIGFDFNPEIEMGWQHYFMMGLNEETTGGYNVEDGIMVGKYQTSKSDRIAAEMRIAKDRLKEKGLVGSIDFWLKKMVKVFNDGTFAWYSEGVHIEEYYPENLASNTAFTTFWRERVWPDAPHSGRYKTFCQLIWLFCLTGVPGITLCRKEKYGEYAILTICFLGIFLYQMLFEASARYLYLFIPLVAVMSVCGMWKYAEYTEAFWKKHQK